MSNDIQFILGLRAVWEGFAIGALIMLGMICVHALWSYLMGNLR